jgi:hypothetical protein
VGEKKALRFFEAFSVILFFTQALRVIFSVLFGIIYDQVFAGTPGIWLAVSNLLVLAAFLSPLVLPRRAGRRWLTGCAMIAGAARIGLTVNNSSVRFWSSLVVLAAGGLYLALLARKAQPTLLPGVFSALAVDQLLHLWGDTYDLSLRPDWLPLQVTGIAGAGCGTLAGAPGWG